MQLSRRIARVLGPVIVLLAPTEAFHLGIFAGVTAALVYLNGTLLFAAGVAILQGHHRWTPDWTALVTLTGWALVVGGAYRMIAPTGPQAVESAAAYALMAVLFVVGAVLSWQGYRRPRGP